MTPISVLTLVRNREPHLAQLVEGLRRSAMAPAELIVVDMSDQPVAQPDADFPIHIHRLESDALPLAAARNLAASRARSPHLLFLDVDCIPMAQCIGTMAAALEARAEIAQGGDALAQACAGAHPCVHRLPAGRFRWCRPRSLAAGGRLRYAGAPKPPCFQKQLDGSIITLRLTE